SITNNVLLTNNLGVLTHFAVSLANGNQLLRVAPDRPLNPGAIYTNILLPALTDVSGNPWQNLGGAAVPSGAAPFSFTTARPLGTSPTNGTRVVAGQSVTVTAFYESGLGARLFRFQLNSGSPVQVSAGLTNTGAILVIPTNATQATISV